MVVHTTHAYKRESITNFAERAQVGTVIEVDVLHRTVFRLGGIQPPTVHSNAEQVLIHIFPEDFPCCRVVGIIHLHTVILREGFVYHQFVHPFQLGIYSGSRSERGPYGNNGVSIQAVHIFHHLPGIGELGVAEFHGIPVFMVFAPVAPVLDDAIQRHFQVAVFLNHAYQLVLADVAFSRLPKAKCPKGEHGSFSGELAQLRNHSVGTTAIYEVIIAEVAHCRIESHALRIVRKGSGGIVIPVQGVSLDGMDKRNTDFRIRLLQENSLVTLVHPPLLVLSQTINSLITIQHESLANLIGRISRIIEWSKTNRRRLLS